MVVCILGGSLLSSVLASALLGKQLCGFCSWNPYLEPPSFPRGFPSTAGECESPLVVPQLGVSWGIFLFFVNIVVGITRRGLTGLHMWGSFYFC